VENRGAQFSNEPTIVLEKAGRPERDFVFVFGLLRSLEDEAKPVELPALLRFLNRLQKAGLVGRFRKGMSSASGW
jgi:hypothetical protein